MRKIGKIVNTHGIRGEVRAFLTSFDIYDKLLDMKTVYINDKEYEINSVRKHKKFTLITFKGFNNINQVLDLKDQDLYFLDDEREDVFLLEQLEGYEVHDINGKVIGTIENVFFNGAQYVGELEKTMILLTDNFIEAIDQEKKILISTYPVNYED